MEPDDNENNDVQLIVGGLDFVGWKAATVRRKMTNCSGGFELDLATTFRYDKIDFLRRERDEGRGAVSVNTIRPGESCELKMGFDSVLVGYVETVDEAIDGDSHTIAISGRDKTADLIDCSAIGKTGQWLGSRVEQIAEQLAKPFGVSVRAEVDTGAALRSFALQEGESVFAAVERAAKLRGLLLTSGRDGALVITRAGLKESKTRLVLGENVLSARATFDVRDRYSAYIMKGQVAGTDFASGPSASQLKAQAEDAGVSRYRPLLIVNDTPDTSGAMIDRVRWEANCRAARSISFEVRVQGWRDASGLWAVNTLVPVVLARLGVYATLLIVGVEFTKDAGGTVTTLGLTRSDAYSPEPLAIAPGVPKNFWDLPGVIATGGRK